MIKYYYSMKVSNLFAIFMHLNIHKNKYIFKFNVSYCLKCAQYEINQFKRIFASLVWTLINNQ